MLFSLTADYTPAALRAMRENPDTGNRQDAVAKLVEAAGSKLVAMYFRIHDGPGAQAIFDLPDPSMVASIASIIVQSETLIVRISTKRIRVSPDHHRSVRLIPQKLSHFMQRSLCIRTDVSLVKVEQHIIRQTDFLAAILLFAGLRLIAG
jgi:uncharacterized protein with GYD domain